MAPSEAATAGQRSERDQLLHDLAQETLERYREINLLYRASETLGASLDANEVPRLLVEEAERVIPADAAIVLLGDADPPTDWSAHRELIASVRASGRPDYTKSALCAPVRAGESVLGVVVLGRSEGGKWFTAGDEKLLLGLASQAGIALERAWLHEQEKSRLQLEEELAVARRIQLTLLPSAVPEVAGWDFAAAYQAARQVGGDFYDFILGPGVDGRPTDGVLGIVIADVTGKGVPAALMMAHSRAVLRAEAMSGHSPLDVLRNSNRMFMQERQSRLFLSACYCTIDLGSGRVGYASAGHDAPLLVRASGSVTLLEAPGVVLGAFHDDGLEERSVVLGDRDTIVLYTDGVTEARDPERRLFGDERLIAAAAAAVADGGSAQHVRDSVLAAVGAFTAGSEQADDLTIVVVQRVGGGAGMGG